MIVCCQACAKSWRYPCEPCRDGFIAYHRSVTGHEMVVRTPDEFKFEAQEVAWWEDLENRRENRRRRRRRGIGPA